MYTITIDDDSYSDLVGALLTRGLMRDERGDRCLALWLELISAKR